MKLLSRIGQFTSRILSLPTELRKLNEANDEIKLLLGGIHADRVRNKENYENLGDLEFKVFSQFGDDGIIQYLVSRLGFKNKTFVEFGVEDYRESNTRFLLQHNGWTGFVMDSSPENIDSLKNSSFYWQHQITAQSVFVTAENINQLLSSATGDWPGIDILHIDIDSTDYWIWKALTVNPGLVIMEYNANFGIDRALTVPYQPSFDRNAAHHSNLYWGASLKALHTLATDRDYRFIGCNSAGNNAYFVRSDLMNESVSEVSLEAGFVPSRYREARDEAGNLTFASYAERMKLIRGLPAYDVETEQLSQI